MFAFTGCYVNVQWMFRGDDVYEARLELHPLTLLRRDGKKSCETAQGQGQRFPLL